MSYMVTGRIPVPELRSDIERLRRLLEDLESIRRGDHPSAGRIAKAPVLNNWEMAQRLELCLSGVVNGHPIITDDKEAYTSALWVISPELGYARTFSRLYKLGAPFADPSLH
uniref:Uncharacterized protein n=1 Tax=Rhodopseudomonas palustris (strain DX-1) TaxID=652103 RepID=E6VQ05_RHOPX